MSHFELDKLVTAGPIAQRIGALPVHITKLAKRGAIQFKMVAGRMVFSLDNLDAIRAACVKAGYLPAHEPQTATA